MFGRPHHIFRRSLRLQAFRRGINLPAQPQRYHSSVLAASKQCKHTSELLRQFSRPFSSTVSLSRPSGTVDEELITKLESEISVETQMGEYEEMPANLKEFVETGEFNLKDRPGMEEVELVRRFGDETIRVMFSISDLNDIDDKFEDEALYEGEDATDIAQDSEASSKKERTSATSNAEEEDQEFEETNEPAYPARLNITIEKPTSGALQIEAIAQDGMIVIENVHYHKSAQLATAQGAEADWERRGSYVGPPFGNLDEDLQVLLERYLDERGINTALAMFVPDYIDYKEQKEYLAWLNNVKTFVQA